jgi:CTP:molybdopterin cytidylyltransferase MocA
LCGWRLDITAESEAEESRQRYLAEREQRDGVAETVESAVASETGEAVLAESQGDVPSIDPEVLRRLEEFKREMLQQ